MTNPAADRPFFHIAPLVPGDEPGLVALFREGTVQKLGDEDGNGMTCHAETGWESVDGVGAAAGRNGRRQV